MVKTGYTLLELLAIICISAIFASIGLSHWHNIKLRNELIMTTRQLAYFLNEVQTAAYSNNQTYHLYLFTSPWCLMASIGEKPTSCLGDFRFIKANNSVVIEGLTDKKIISFWGRRNMAQTASLQLKNNAGQSKIIISFRGRIRICSNNANLAGIPAC